MRIVRIVELSNHPVEMLDHERDRRALAEQQQQEAYEHELARHRASFEQAREVREQARTNWRLWRWLRCTLKLWMLESESPQPPAVLAGTREEAKVSAGARAERAIADRLARSLGEEWVLLCGYRNRRGEVDQLLLGPGGFFAIEIKYRNATVHCDGDSWWFEKYDRYGNRVGEGRITDRRGRSPSRQLREPVAELQEFLARRGQPTRIKPIVLLTHARSRLGSMRNLTVDVATCPEYVLEVAAASQNALDAERCAAIERLIIQDHAFHANRRPQRA
jgi:hypothetical protein